MDPGRKPAEACSTGRSEDPIAAPARGSVLPGASPAPEPADLEQEAPAYQIGPERPRQPPRRLARSRRWRARRPRSAPAPPPAARPGGPPARPSRIPGRTSRRTRSQGSLPGFRAGTNPAPSGGRHGPAEDEPAGLDADDVGHSVPRNGSAIASTTSRNSGPSREHRGDVLEDDPRLGVVGNRPQRVAAPGAPSGRRRSSSDVEAPRGTGRRSASSCAPPRPPGRGPAPPAAAPPAEPSAAVVAARRHHFDPAVGQVPRVAARGRAPRACRATNQRNPTPCTTPDTRNRGSRRPAAPRRAVPRRRSA